jgi:hypothetical protein
MFSRAPAAPKQRHNKYPDMKEITKFPFKIRFDGHDLSAEEVTEEMLFQNFRFIRNRP